jgi:hypothetical protein
MGDSDQVGVHCWGGKGSRESQGSKENNRTAVLWESGDHGVGPVFILMEGCYKPSQKLWGRKMFRAAKPKVNVVEN